MPLLRSPADLRAFVLADPLCRRLAEAAGPDRPIALVGGWVRDWLLGRAAPDWDLVTPGDPLDLARALGHVVTLDAGFGIHRARLRGGPELDFAKAVGDDIETDLRRRDLTINAMAVRLGDGALLDPVGGLADLAVGVVRAPSRANLHDDPLRLVRVHRFAATLGFAVDATTLAWSRELAPELDRSAGERVMAELGKLLASGNAAPSLRAMEATGVLARALEHAAPDVALAAAVEARMAEAPEALAPWLAEKAYGERTRGGTVLLGALLRGRDPRPTAARLRWSKAEDKVLALLATHPHPQALDARATHRYLKATGDAAPGLALMADDPALLGAWLHRRAHPLPRLVDGNALMAIGARPGPGLAALLAAIEEAQALGELGTAAEALAWAGNRLE